MTITIPGFVMNGLATMADPTLADFSRVCYRSEADLRDAMAASWWLHGWTVRTEVKVPDCGRIDVLAQSANQTVVIELKKKITSSTQARQAFQQAHAYLSYLRAAEPDLKDWDARRRFSAIVSAADWELAAVDPADRAYRDVDFMDFASLSDFAFNAPWAMTPMALDQAARISRLRHTHLAVLASASRAACNRLTLAREDVAA
jgi:hypothetical protein